jgi:predicted nucleotidyltransferase
MTTTLYIIGGILLLWLIGVDVRYYQISKKISLLHKADKHLLELFDSAKLLKNEKEKEKEDKPEFKRNNKKRVIKKSKRVRTPKSSS